MSKDILFKTEDFVFSYRAGGLLIHNDKILLQRPKNDDFAIIGGHVSCLETTTETLKSPATKYVCTIKFICSTMVSRWKAPFLDMMIGITRELTWNFAGFLWRN